MLVYSRKVYPKTQRSTDNSAKTLQNLTLTLGINNSKSELCKNSLKKLGLAVYELFKSSSLSAHEKEMEQCRN